MSSEELEQSLVEANADAIETRTEGSKEVEEPSWKGVKAIDIGELFFGRSITNFLSDLTSPKLVIAWKPRNRRYSYIQFLARVLRDAYRVFHGSIPVARYIQYSSDINSRLSWIPIQGSIVVVDLPSGFGRSIDCRIKIEERLREFVSQGPGFLILYVSEDCRRDVESLVSEVFNDVTCPDILEVSIDEERSLEVYLKIVAAYSGFIDFEEFESVKSIDALSMYLEAATRRILFEVATSDPLVKEYSCVCSEGEDIQRFLIRALVIKDYLSKFPGANVSTCYRVARGLDVDVYRRDRDEAIFIETMANAKIVEARVRLVASTLLGNFSRVTMVVPNWTLMIFAPRIVEALKDVTKWGGFVELACLDVSRLKLVTYGELMSRLAS